MTTREKIMDILKERMDQGNPIVLQEDIIGHQSIETGKRNIQKQAKILRQDDKLIQGYVKSGKKAYAHSEANVPELEGESNKEEMKEQLAEVYQRAEEILAGYRKPTLEEIARLGHFDEQNEEFRDVYNDLVESKETNVTGEYTIEENNEKVVNKIVTSILIDEGYIRYEDPEEEKEKQKEARQYLSNNELKDHIDVKYGGRNSGGQPDRIYIEFDEELEILLRQSTIKREI